MGYDQFPFVRKIGSHVFYRFPTKEYPSIKLGKTGYIEAKFGTSDYFKILSETVQVLKATYASNVSTLEGGNVTGDDLTLKANTVDATPYAQFLGGSGVKIDVATGADINFSDAGTTEHVFTLGGGGAGAVHYFRETTTPTAIPDFGALYTKADNHLYWQSGAGVEYDLGGA